MKKTNKESNKESTKWMPVASSTISCISYHEDERALYIMFKNGAIYMYEGVSKNLYTEFANSESLGSFLARRIRPAFKGIKVSSRSNMETD